MVKQRTPQKNKMEFATAMKILQMKFIITPEVVDGEVRKWNICDNKEIDLDIWSEKDLIEYAEESRRAN
jgi:hypothetical protein